MQQVHCWLPLLKGTGLSLRALAGLTQTLPSCTLPAENECGPLPDPDLDGKLAQTSHNSCTEKSFLGLFDLCKKIIPINPSSQKFKVGEGTE